MINDLSIVAYKNSPVNLIYPGNFCQFPLNKFDFGDFWEIFSEQPLINF